jgi:hypothetical protein
VLKYKAQYKKIRDEIDFYAIVNRVQTGVHLRALFIEVSLAAISGNGTGTAVALGFG